MVFDLKNAQISCPRDKFSVFWPLLATPIAYIDNKSRVRQSSLEMILILAQFTLKGGTSV
jgi:hypothetical protein